MDYKDYYQTLGVPKTATTADIRKAYRKLARELHPDRNPGDKTAERRFKDVNEAHAVLSDPDKRKQYDTLGANWEQFSRAGAGAAGSNPFAGFGGNPYAGAYGAGQGPFGGQNGNIRYEFHGANADEFSDFFRMFFGGEMNADEPLTQTRTRTRSGASAASGASGATGTGTGTGSRSGGSGGSRRSGPLDDLLGRLHFQQAGTAGTTGTAGRGRQSAGRGHGQDSEIEVDLGLEEAFNGSTRLVQIGDKRLEVKVPAGVETGSKIRLAGKGPDGGDLYLVTRVRPHGTFTRNGADLTREVPITLQEALLGGQVEVGTLNGRVLLTVPAGTQQGQTFRLTGKGMPRLRGEGHGDLYAKMKVVLPTRLDENAKKAAEAFLDLVDQPNPRTS